MTPMTKRLRPLAKPGAATRVAPFAALALIAFASVPLPILHPESDPRVTIALAATLCLIASFLFTPWRSLPEGVRALPALSYFAVVALMRDADGGAVSSFSPLVLLPVIWLALYGTRRELVASVFLVATVFAAPILVVGEPPYPIGEWRRVLIWTVASAVLGGTVQRLVVDIRERAATQAAVARIVRQLPTSHDARQKVCDAVCELSGAPKALLLEPDGRGNLVSTAMSGMDHAKLTLRIGREPSGAVIAMAAQEAFFFPDVHDNPAVATEFVRAIHARSAYFQPVMQGSEAVGVIGVFWTDYQARLSDRVAAAVALMGWEAAVAIERADLLERLEEQAQTDSLTGLPNLRRWNSELPREISRSKRAGKPLSIALVDLDFFKEYNDTYGHPAGNRMLTEAASAWRAELRDVDLLARTGGDEFAVILHECDTGRASEVIQRMDAATPKGQTCSIGIASWDADEDFEELTARADAALYEAKRNGRGRTELAGTRALSSVKSEPSPQPPEPAPIRSRA